MPNSRHNEAMLSPSLSRITKRMRSSITDRSFHGIPQPPPSGGKSVTHVSGTLCYLCVGTVNLDFGLTGPLRRALPLAFLAKSMRVTFWGAAGAVTGSMHLLEAA